MSDHVVYSAKVPNYSDPESRSKPEARFNVDVFERDCSVGIRIADADAPSTNATDAHIKAIVLHPDEAEDLITALKDAIVGARRKIKDSGNAPPKNVEKY